MSDDGFYKIIWKNILEIRRNTLEASKKSLRDLTAKDVLWVIILDLFIFTVVTALVVAVALMPTLFSSIGRFLGKARYLLFKKIIDLEDSLKSQKHKNFILTDENFGLTSENHKLTDRNCELTNINRALTDETHELTNINRVLIDEKNQVTKKNSALIEEKNQVTKKNCELIEEKNQITKKNSALIEEKNQVTKKNCELIEERCELTKKNCELIEERCELTKKNCELTDEKRELTNINRALIEEKNQVTKKNSELNNEILTLKIKISQLEAKGKINNPSESNIMGHEKALGILKINARNPSQAEISGAYRNAVARFHPNSAPVGQSVKGELLSKNLHHLSAHSLYETVQEASKGEGIYIDKLFKSTAEKIVFEATQAKDFLTDYEDKVRQMDEKGESKTKKDYLNNNDFSIYCNPISSINKK